MTAAPNLTADEGAVSPLVVTTEIGTIGPSSADLLEATMAKARAEKADAILLIIDTPGGLLTSTRSMVQTILNSDIPVIAWVGPKGARAASAGSFITMAADVAVMAPATNIGAAHPISAGLPSDEGDAADHSKIKILNDTVALAESIATTRVRNIEMARSFVLSSTSITAEEALEHRVIDLIAASETELWSQLDTRTISRGNSRPFTLKGRNVSLMRTERTWRHRILDFISDPNVFYLLFLAGIIGLGFELTHPGGIFPGVAGAISLLLALIAMSTLPINSGGLGLIILGIVLLIAELFVPSFGTLGIGGMIAFFLGSTLLFEQGSGLSLSMWTIVPVLLGIVVIGGFVGTATVRALRSNVATGQQGLESWVGKTVQAHRDFMGSEGFVRIEGELWKAVAPAHSTIFTGDQLRITGANGLVLTVEKLS